MSDESPRARVRIESIDLVRGVIMAIMALDHTRDFFGVPGQSPTNLATASGALFLTRWITNVCAPVFFLLTGTGAYLSLQRRTTADLSRFLFTRGVWLIVLELVIVRCLIYQFNVDYRVTMLLVLWALGWSMIVLAALVWLPVRVVAAVGLAVIAGHNLLDGAQLSGPVWLLLHGQGVVWNSNRHVVFSAYPLIPWVGVTAVGYGLGQIYTWDAERRRALLFRLGGAATIAFVLLRTVNSYGDPARWSPQTSPAFAVLSFLNATKYPPSLLFLLMTLGPVLAALGALDRGTPRVLAPALILGRVPLFYYGIHFLFIHLLAVVVCYARYGSAHWMFESANLASFPFTPPPGWGYSLPVVYAAWALVVGAAYPICAWYAALRGRRRDRWLSYL